MKKYRNPVSDVRRLAELAAASAELAGRKIFPTAADDVSEIALLFIKLKRSPDAAAYAALLYVANFMGRQKPTKIDMVVQASEIIRGFKALCEMAFEDEQAKLR